MKFATLIPQFQRRRAEAITRFFPRNHPIDLAGTIILGTLGSALLALMFLQKEYSILWFLLLLPLFHTAFASFPFARALRVMGNRAWREDLSLTFIDPARVVEQVVDRFFERLFVHFTAFALVIMAAYEIHIEVEVNNIYGSHAYFVRSPRLVGALERMDAGIIYLIFGTTAIYGYLLACCRILNAACSSSGRMDGTSLAKLSFLAPFASFALVAACFYLFFLLTRGFKSPPYLICVGFMAGVRQWALTQRRSLAEKLFKLC